MTTQSKTTTIWEAEQDMDGGGNPLSSWSAYWIDEAGDAHPLVESTDRQTARLIAAAPDMLEAARAVVWNATTGEAPSGFALVRLEDFSALSAAIAKAQGAQP